MGGGNDATRTPCSLSALEPVHRFGRKITLSKRGPLGLAARTCASTHGARPYDDQKLLLALSGGQVMTLTKVGLVLLSCGLSTTTLLSAQTARNEQETAERVNIAAANVEDAAVIDCQLPGKLQKLGGTRTYLTPGRLTRLPAIDCRVRGGEYTLGDLSSATFSLQRWLPVAEQGDAEAQYYVARIYANGMSEVPVDYAVAANWYGRAAKQGYSSAQTELGYLYEKGLGVKQDLKLALDLQRQGAGLGEELDYAWKIAATKENADRQIADLSAQLEASNATLESLRAELGQTRDSLSNSRARLAKSQAAVESLRTDLEEARLAVTGADPARVKTLESELLSRSADLKDSQAKVAQLESRLAAQQSQIDSSISSSQVTNAQLNEIRTAAKSANMQVDDLRAQLEQAQLRLTNAREELSRQRDQYKREVDALVAKHQKALESTRSNATQSTSTAEIENLNQQLAASNEELAARERTLASLENTTDMLRDQIKRLQEGRTAEMARMKNETQRLQGQLADQRDRLEKAETEGANLQKALLGSRTRLEQEKTRRQADQKLVVTLELQIQDQKKKLEANQAYIAGLLELVNKGTPVSPPDRATPAPRPVVAQVDSNSPAQKLLVKARSLNRGTYYALIIGNTNYRTWSRLNTGVPDAEAVARVLERNYDFKVQLLRDASSKDIETALFNWSRKLQDGDSFLVYYAGHSISDKPGSEKWLGVEADSSTLDGYLDSSRIQDQIEQMRAKSVLVVADCCLAGTTTHARSTKFGREWDEKSFAVRFQSKARLVLTSAPMPRAGVDAVNNRDHSPFAESFVQVLRGSKVVMSGQELACELGERLRQAAAENATGLVPIYSDLKGRGHGGGEFFFVPAPLVAAERVAAVF